MGAVEAVRMQDLHRNVVVCNIVVACKGSQMSRLCWSGKTINNGMDGKGFKMETWETIAQMARKGDWAFSLDLEKGYMRVGLDERMKNFCVLG